MKKLALLSLIVIFQVSSLNSFKVSLIDNIGNALAAYFFINAREQVKNESAYEVVFSTIEIPEISEIPEIPEINAFLESLPKKMNLEKSTLLKFRKLNKAVWRTKPSSSWCYGSWRGTEEDYNLFWSELGPYIYRVLSKCLNAKNLNCKNLLPTLHFRCSDVPYVKHPSYHLNYSEYYRFVAKEVKKLGGRKLLLVHAGTHAAKKNMEQATVKYFQSICKILNNEGIEVVPQSSSVFSDFVALFNAPRLFGTGGSFSFMAGVGSIGSFTASCLGREKGSKYIQPINLSWVYTPIPLLHTHVKSYYDTDDVIKQLYSR